MPQLSRRTGLSLVVRRARPRAEALEARTLLAIPAFSANFDGAPTTLPGVTAQFSGVTTVESVQDYMGLGTGTNQFAGQLLRNESGGTPLGTSGSPTTLTLTGLPSHTSIDLNFLLAVIDTWDGSLVGTPHSGNGTGDYFRVTVDGNDLFDESFEHKNNGGPQSYIPPAGVRLASGVELGFNRSYLDAAYDMGLDPLFDDITHTASSLTITWLARGTGWQGGTDESWGIENVEVVLNSVPDLIATSLTWNPEQGGVDFGYEVAGAALTEDTTAGLYWASGETFNTAIDANPNLPGINPAYETTIERPIGQYGPFYVPTPVLGTPPPGATHLLLAVDPPATPNGLIQESDETNNVRSIAIPPPADIRVVDDGDAGWTSTGSWSLSGLGGANGDSRYAAPGAAAAATWTFAVTPGQTYRVAATWPSHSNRATNARFDVLQGSSVIGGGTVNQQIAPNDFVASNTVWENLGADLTVSGSTLVVRLTNAADGIVGADAVRIEPVAPPPTDIRIVDDGDAGWTSTGSWSLSGLGGHLGDSRYATPGAPASATWSFAVTPGQTYRLATTWPAHVNRASNARFDILEGSTIIGGAALNQKVLPDDFTAEGIAWEHLGEFVTATGATLVVRLNNAANGIVGADAVRLEPVNPPAVAIVDDGDAGWASSGFANLSSLGGHLGDSRYAQPAGELQWATWTFAVTPGQTYRVSATWANHANRASNASYELLVDGTPVGALSVDQRVAPNDFSDAGSAWEDLGESIVVNGSTLVVRLTNGAAGVVSADAVRIERQP